MDTKNLFYQALDLYQQGEVNQAIKIWQSIERKDSPEVYAEAQFNLGLALRQQGDVEGAIKTYRNIHREDSKEWYAKAQFNLGNILKQQNSVKEAIKTYRNIQREDSPEIYADAQFNLGIILNQQDDVQGAIEAWCNVKLEDSKAQYTKAQFNLELILKQSDKIKQPWQNIKDDNYYEMESYKKILNCQKDDRENLKEIFDNTTKLLQKLHIKSDNTYEQKVAHYTKATVAKLLIQGDDKNSPSSFRLNSIKNVNDPTEGLVLGEYLQNQSKPQQALINDIFTDDEYTNVFISCFTFNHDSLNQFRLYGKEDNKEASGVSLVFKPEFFNHTTKFGFMGQTLKFNELYNPKEQSNKSETPNKTQPLQQALYRCIYIDPKSGYLRLAQRNKITFYREAQYGGEDPSEAQKNYTDYKGKYIEAEEKEVEKSLKEITKQIEEILQNSTKEILEAIGFILLPLRYLIKHAAFQEEQECRMIYITDLNDKKICEDWHNKNLYINYDVEVKNMVDKIYLSPGAYAYADFFRRMLPKNQDGKERVRRSDNPFRC